MTCRDDVLAAIHVLIRHHTDPTFTADEVVKMALARGTRYTPQTIRSYVTYTLCRPERVPGRGVYDDLERVSRGRYRLRDRR